MIAIASDHGGYDLKERVKKYLEEKNIPYQDMGCDSKASCDYPVFGHAAARAVADGTCEKGIVICTTGIGISISANKVKGIRCALCSDPLSAKMTRLHNDANMLAMGAGIVGENLALEIVETFLNTPFSGEERHSRRISLIEEVECITQIRTTTKYHYNKYKTQEDNNMSKVVVMDHPLIEQKIGIIRRKETGTKDFRQNISEIAMLIGYEATKDLPLEEVEIETPICKTTVKQLKGKKLALVPILRAGLGMVDGMLSLIPAAKVGHIGLYRNPETLKPVEYYCKLPADCAEREVFVVDPMLATGGSSIAAIQLLKDKGCKSIRLLCIIAAPEGVKAMQEAHPDVDIYIGALDQKLNDHGYIVPGLGDAGDRIFGTK